MVFFLFLKLFGWNIWNMWLILLGKLFGILVRSNFAFRWRKNAVQLALFEHCSTALGSMYCESVRSFNIGSIAYIYIYIYILCSASTAIAYFEIFRIKSFVCSALESVFKSLKLKIIPITEADEWREKKCAHNIQIRIYIQTATK